MLMESIKGILTGARPIERWNSTQVSTAS
jgi:hypothetical protein